MVEALALRSGDPGFETRSDHALNLFWVVPGQEPIRVETCNARSHLPNIQS